jgi:hypothetical protein
MKRIALSLLFVVFAFLFLAACFSPWSGDEATLTINLFSGSNGRSADLEWPPSSLDGNEIYFRYPSEFIVILDGPTGREKESFKFNVGTPYTDTKFSFTVVPGNWKIYIEIIIHDNFLYATGSNSVNVQGGKTNSVEVTMKKEYYEIGSYGPANGIIFYVNPEGFILYDIEGGKNKICYYLEAAPEDAFVAPSEPYLPWGPNDEFSVDGTDTGIGNGRKNTQIIVNALNGGETGMAAQLCADANYSGFNDWFLPSLDEFCCMYLNLYEKLGNFLVIDSSPYCYWSSSMTYDDVFCISVYESGGCEFEVFSPDNNENRVRAIRAF